MMLRGHKECSFLVSVFIPLKNYFSNCIVDLFLFLNFCQFINLHLMFVLRYQKIKQLGQKSHSKISQKNIQSKTFPQLHPILRLLVTTIKNLCQSQFSLILSKVERCTLYDGSSYYPYSGRALPLFGF